MDENVHIRGMIRADSDAVMEIDSVSAAPRFASHEDLHENLRRRTCIGMVAEDRKSELLAGFMVWDLAATAIVINQLTVAPGMRRLGIGSMMWQKLVGKLCTFKRRSGLVWRIPDNGATLGTQMFLKAKGARCIQIDRAQPDDLLVFRWSLQDTARKFAPSNRLRGLVGGGGGDV